MLCRECITPELQTVNAQKMVIDQLASLQIRCPLCMMCMELGHRENHFVEQCQELTITRCAFNDCKVLQACVREDFERHLEEECKSKTKMCDVCDCDLYAMYADDDFR